MKRAPSAGNERITVEDARRIASDGIDIMSTLADEAPRALRIAREWEGNMRAAAGGGGGSDHPDPTGEVAMRPEWTAGVYGILVQRIRQANVVHADIARMLGMLRRSEANDDASHDLAKSNAVAGPCDVCSHHASGKDNDRLRPLVGSDERGCHACTESWRSARHSDVDLKYRVWKRMRQQRLERSPETAA